MSLFSPKEHWSGGNVSHTKSSESSDVGLGGSCLASVEKLPQINQPLAPLWNAPYFLWRQHCTSQSLLGICCDSSRVTTILLSLVWSPPRKGLLFFQEQFVWLTDRVQNQRAAMTSPPVPCWLNGDFSCSMKPRTPSGNWSWALLTCPCPPPGTGQEPFPPPQSFFPARKKAFGGSWQPFMWVLEEVWDVK